MPRGWPVMHDDGGRVHDVHPPRIAISGTQGAHEDAGLTLVTVTGPDLGRRAVTLPCTARFASG